MSLERNETARRFMEALLHAGEPQEIAKTVEIAVGCTDALLAALAPVAGPDQPKAGHEPEGREPRRTVGAVVRWRGQDHPDEEWLLVGNNKAVALKIRKPHLLDCGTNQDGGGDEFVRWATRAECAWHGIPYVARPLPGAPLAAPSRPEWVRITSLNAGGKSFLTVGKVYRVTGFGHRGCPQVNNDQGDGMWCLSSRGLSPDPESPTFASWEPCAAPSPAATPAAWVPSVGDRVRRDGRDDGHRFVVTGTDPIEVIRVDAKRSAFCVRGPWTRNAAPVYDGPATSSERAAAGLPVDESATKPVDRVALAKALWRSWNGDDDVGYSGEVREGYVRAADAAIAFMAKGGA